MSPVSNKKMFFTLTVMGLLGVLSMMSMPLPEGVDVPLSPAMLKLFGFIQSTIFVMLAVAGGLFFTGRLGFEAPVIKAALTGQPMMAALKPQVLPAVIGGISAGALIVGVAVLMQPYLPQEFVQNGQQMSENTPVLARFLYGGITEEILLRWFFMSLLVWLPFKLVQKGQGTPKAGFVWLGVVGAAILFGLGHLPMAFTLVEQPTALLIGYIISLNAVFGVIGGWLFWKKGLESAILAHMMAHVVMLAAT